MPDFSQLLAAQSEAIIERWILQLRQDRQIDEALHLSDTALGDSMPDLLAAMVTVLARSPQDGDYTTIAKASLEHGTYRARQGFDPADIAREYSLLRREIFSALETGMLQATTAEVIRGFRLIDAILDQATSQSYRSYVQARLQQLEQLQSQLQLTNQELVRLNQSTQNTFTYLSQELKTPLNLIVGYSELLLRQQQRTLSQGEKAEDKTGSLERVLQYGRQLLRLVNDSLELARTESGDIQLRTLTTDVGTVLSGVLSVMQPIAEAKGLDLVCDSSDVPGQITTDPFRLQQILTNLLQNAINYTESGSVQVSCRTLSEERWSLAVADTGVGIAPEDQQRIFEPYSSVFVENIRQERQGSTGLSLAVVARLVRLLQGEINLVSQVGLGSTFTLTFPITLRLDPEPGESGAASP
jgi:signal transduction histidine kinase